MDSFGTYSPALAQNYVLIGHVPGTDVYLRLPRLVGYTRAVHISLYLLAIMSLPGYQSRGDRSVTLNLSAVSKVGSQFVPVALACTEEQRTDSLMTAALYVSSWVPDSTDDRSTYIDATTRITIAV